MKNVVVLGGGNGQSVLLRGLKEFPVHLTSIVSVCDDGKSTGRLREEFHTPAVGDLRRVLITLANTEPLMEKLFNYRFQTTSDLNDHALGNLLLTAMTNVTGNLTEGIASLSKVLNLKGKVLPFTEDNAVLMAEMNDGTIVEGEHHITDSSKSIRRVFYKEPIQVTADVLAAIEKADYILFSIGSVYTSILPNLLCPEMIAAIVRSKAKLISVCNLMTQPGETDGWKASDHIRTLNQYLAPASIDVIVVNVGEISTDVIQKYKVKEQKDPVIVDQLELEKLGLKIISNNYVWIEDMMIRHNTNLLALDLYSYFLNDCSLK